MVAPKHLFEQDLTTTLGRCQIQQLDPKYGLKILDFKLIFGIQLLDLTATQSRCQILLKQVFWGDHHLKAERIEQFTYYSN